MTRLSYDLKPMTLSIDDKSGHSAYEASNDRYRTMAYRRCGASGVLLPELSLGLWQNFGFVDSLQTARKILRTAFDCGIVHFDLANNYGPPYGSAEENFGTLMRADFAGYRDELFIATKAGFDMWPGPYGNHGSRKYLLASVDQSLRRMGLEYVDIFYHHRPDPATPLEETLGAVRDIVRQGKALYAGISNYDAPATEKAATFFREERIPLILHQARYSLLNRQVESGLLDVLSDNGIGCIAFSPLAQGMLTDRYLDGIPEGSRATKATSYLSEADVLQKTDVIRQLHRVAIERNQTLAQMAIAWLLNRKAVCSVLLGASSADQLRDNLKGLDNTAFEADELEKIDRLTLQDI